MGKSDTILKQMGGNLAESIGIRSMRPAGPAPQGPRAIPATSPRDGFTRSRQSGDMLLANIVPDPDQPRKEFEPGAVERLAESIKAHGILQPIRVRWNPTLGKHVILVGERRYRASLMAGLASVPCTFVEDELTQAEILEEQLIENLLREDLSPIETAESFRRYMDMVGCTGKDLAGLLRVDPSTVTRSLSLLTLPEPIQDKIATGIIPMRAGLEIAKLKDEPAQSQMAERVVAERMTADDVTSAVRQKRGKAAQKGRGTTRTFRTEKGHKVAFSSNRRASQADIVDALQEALDQAKKEFE